MAATTSLEFREQYNNVVKCSRFVGGPVRVLGLNYDCLPCLAVFVLLAKTEVVIAFSKLSMGIPALVSPEEIQD